MGGVILRTIDPVPRERMAKRFGCSRKELEDFVFSSPTSIQSEIGQLGDMQHWRAVLEHFNQADLTPDEAYYEFFSGDAIDRELLEFARNLKRKSDRPHLWGQGATGGYAVLPAASAELREVRSADYGATFSPTFAANVR